MFIEDRFGQELISLSKLQVMLTFSQGSDGYLCWLIFNLKNNTKFEQMLDDIRIEQFQDSLNSIGLILNLIQGHSTILCLKKEVVGL